MSATFNKRQLFFEQLRSPFTSGIVSKLVFRSVCADWSQSAFDGLMGVWVMATAHCIPPVRRGMNCPSHQRSPLISLVGRTRRERAQVKKRQQALQRHGLEKERNSERTQRLELLVLRLIPRVQFIWNGFRGLWWDCHAVWPYTLTGLTICYRPQTHFSADVSNFKCRPPNPTLECRCLNMAGK